MLPEPWYIIGYDQFGETIEAAGRIPDELANKVASWAQQEADRWPELGLIYMLVSREDLKDADL